MARCGIIARPNRQSKVRASIVTEVVIIGAGPCGLFQVFELGLLGISCARRRFARDPGRPVHRAVSRQAHLRHPGAAGLRCAGAGRPADAADHAVQCAVSPRPGSHRAAASARTAASTSKPSSGTAFDAGAVVIAGGVGSFQPRRIGVRGAEVFEGRNIHYRVRDAASYHGKRLVDLRRRRFRARLGHSSLRRQGRGLTLVHRRAGIRGGPASVAKMRSARGGRHALHRRSGARPCG